jgi:two-component sensor histidine kinase
MVRDNGVGLPPEFDPQDGRSLGITLVEAFTKRFSGEITVEREQGTTVRIRFNRD